MTTPVTTGTRVAYVSQASLFTVIKYAKTAVKKGVVAPTAWLNDTGRYRSDTLPPTTDVQNTTLRVAIFVNCTRDLIVCNGTNFIHTIAT